VHLDEPCPCTMDAPRASRRGGRLAWHGASPIPRVLLTGSHGKRATVRFLLTAGATYQPSVAAPDVLGRRLDLTPPAPYLLAHLADGDRCGVSSGVRQVLSAE